MTKQEAVRILVRHAAANVTGNGPFEHSKLTAEHENQVIQAIELLWSETGHSFSSEEGLYNLGLEL